ncbi:hypothetical protein BJX65DRAFT_41928 [Aspergillus insuetus]
MKSQRILAPGSTASPPVAPRPRAMRTKTSRACSACREKRIKCSGGVPCHKCCQSHTTCLIDPDTDNRRRNSLLQKINTLEDMITNILTTLRDKEKAECFITVVRSNASFTQIQQVLAQSSQETRQSRLIRDLMAIDSLV